MVLLTGTLAFASIVPTLAIEAGFDTVTSGFAMTAYMIGTAIAAVVFGTISDKLGPLKATMVACACGFIALLGSSSSARTCTCSSARCSSTAACPPRWASSAAGARHAVRPEGIRLHLRHRHDGHRHRLHDPHPAYGFIYDATGSFTPALIHDLLLHRRLPDLHDHGLKTGKKVQAMWMPKA